MRYKKSLSEALFILSSKLPMEDNKVKQRVERAYDIVRLASLRTQNSHLPLGDRVEETQRGSGYEITQQVHPVTHECSYRVYRESTSLLEDNSVVYTVDSDGCSCPDAASARAGLCKHRLATMLVEEMCTDKV